MYQEKSTIPNTQSLRKEKEKSLARVVLSTRELTVALGSTVKYTCLLIGAQTQSAIHAFSK